MGATGSTYLRQLPEFPTTKDRFFRAAWDATTAMPEPLASLGPAMRFGDDEFNVEFGRYDEARVFQPITLRRFTVMAIERMTDAELDAAIRAACLDMADEISR